jgi:predicted RNase H-like nuclease
MTRLAGVDGCRAGWIAVLDGGDGTPPGVRVVARIADLFADPATAPDVVAVDMPIGLPERVGLGGRPAERAVRPLLGPRQSSVFSVPSRAAVAAPDFAAACDAALATSDPPRKISRQCFMLFPRIREIDDLLASRPALADRLYESHPEVAFARLAGAPMSLPKKVKSRVHPPGMAERRALLLAEGLPADLLAGPAPRGAGLDDLLDACACLLVARRIADGRARAHPPEEIRDARGLRIAIWA